MNTWFPWTAAVFGLFMLAGLYLIAWWLAQSSDLLRQMAQQLDDASTHSVHDTLHPAFSLRQLRRARERFVDTHRQRLRLEAELYRSHDWLDRRKGSTQPQPSPAVRERGKKVFEALVESECAWKEYLFMIEGNVSVASRGESRAGVLHTFADLLEQTRGIPVKEAIGSNPLKVERAKALLENWTARLSGAKVDSAVPEIPDIGERMFGDVSDEQKDRDRALDESISLD